mmetsp:Transcript_78524/g.163145  ORF Transcript_78524/g.163145 Transcript_78524/m.163145 type:complete len:519 (-) Transcript_78524:342-1898(-)
MAVVEAQAMLLPVLLIVVAIGNVLSAPPSRAECLECLFGTWTCPTKACNTDTSLQSAMSTNFTYQAAGCWEETVPGLHTLNVDLDVWCLLPEQKSDLTCSTMSSFSFNGLAMLNGCLPTSTAAKELVSEASSWLCKDDEPNARCTWHFDPEGYYTSLGGNLESCWMTPVCRGSVVEVDVVCRPDGTWHSTDNLATQLQRARAALTSSQGSHDSAIAVLNSIIESSSNDEAAGIALNTILNQTKEGLAEVVDRLSATLGSINSALSSMNLTADSGAADQLVFQELSAVTEQLRIALSTVESTEAAYESTKQELGNLQASYATLQKQLTISQLEVSSLTSENTNLLAEVEDYKTKLAEAEARVAAANDDDTDDRMLTGAAVAFLVVSIVALLLFFATIIAAACVIGIYRTRLKAAEEQAALIDAGGLLVVGRPIEETQPEASAESSGLRYVSKAEGPASMSSPPSGASANTSAAASAASTASPAIVTTAGVPAAPAAAAAADNDDSITGTQPGQVPKAAW